MKDFLVLEIEDNYGASLRCCMLRFCVCMTEQRNEGDGNTDDSTPTHPSIHPIKLKTFRHPRVAFTRTRYLQVSHTSRTMPRHPRLL